MAPLPSQLFFTVMALSLVGVKYKSDKRDKYLHHGNYLLKLLAWVVFTGLPFLFPNGLVNAYGAQLRSDGAPQQIQLTLHTQRITAGLASSSSSASSAQMVPPQPPTTHARARAHTHTHTDTHTHTT